MSDTRALRSLLAVGVCAAAFTAIAMPASAQTAGSNVIEELVVTAQKKEEALQDVPIAVSAFDQNALEKSKIDGGPNLVLAVPNVTSPRGTSPATTSKSAASARSWWPVRATPAPAST